MAKQSNFDAKEFCLSLLQSETEEEVIDALKKCGYWVDRSAWKPYGDMPNNRSIVGNQQSSSVAALVEKIVNSIDAILMAECYRKGIDPKSPQAPKSMREAAEIYFGIKDGRIQSIDTSGRREFAERIQLVATGTRENPAYIIVDDGEGQSPEKFEDTFLSLARENKTKIPFVQGKHNQGGTGVLQFSGVNSFQLIISKRQPYVPDEGKEKDKWGFTLVRRLDADENHPQSMYVYLAPNGKILSFDADTLPLRPGKFPYAYEEEVLAGTCIKVWNYKLQKGLKTLATLDLRYALERFLQEPVLPIRICERRSSYRAHYFDTTMSGLSAVLVDNRDDVELSDSSLLKVNGVGDVKIRTVVIKEITEGDKKDRYPSGIFFVMNGQLHGEESHSYISRKTNLAYVASSMIVIVDCTDLPSRVREDLFMASRDRMRQIDEKLAIEEAIIDYIKDHPGIKKLNAIRRERRQQSALSEEETAKIIQNLLRSDPTLAHLFGKGDLLRVPGKDITEKEPFIGQRFPTYFRIHNEPKSGLVRHCPKNRTCKIEFETDASNGYFDRSEDQVHINTQGLPQKLSHNLWDGKATLKFGLPDSVSVGDEFKVEVLVSDISRLEPFKSVFKIHVEPEVESTEPPPPVIPKGSTLAAIPNVTEVHRPDWGLHDFDEMSAIEILPGNETGDVLDISINVDNIYLRNDIAKRKNIDANLLIYWFKWGLVLLALGMINSEKRLKNDDENNVEENEKEDMYERVGRACMGIAATLIPVIYHMGKKELLAGE